MSYQFVPDGFKAPYQVITDDYIIRKLTVDEVEKDYKAVMSSKESLRQIFCINDDWPSDHMTLEDNYRDLKEHQDEFDDNSGFAYTVVTTDDSQCIGCLYIYPFSRGVYDCVVYYWFVDEVDKELNSGFRQFIDLWILEAFELCKPAFPGRDMNHNEWEELVEKLKKNQVSGD